MSRIVQRTDLIVTAWNATALTLSDGDSLSVLQGVTVESRYGDGIVGAAGGNFASIAGAVSVGALSLDTGQVGILLPGPSHLVVQSTGSVSVKGGFNNVGIVMIADGSTLTNNGLIRSWGDSDHATTPVAAAGDVTVINHGRIVTDSSNYFGAVQTSGDGFHLFNDGIISTGGRDGIFLGTDAGEHATIVNEGRITGAESSVYGHSGNETVVNRGLLDGDVWLDSGDDIYHGRNGLVLGRVSGGSGNDRLIGGGRDEWLSGDGGSPESNPDNDIIRAGHGDDTLDGDGGADWLLGEAGSDTVSGDAGDDWIAGGTGDDRLSGGTEADLFLFSRGWGRDTIADFEDDRDTIRLDAGALGVTDVDDALAHAAVVGADLVFTFDSGDVLVLENFGNAAGLRNDIVVA